LIRGALDEGLPAFDFGADVAMKDSDVPPHGDDAISASRPEIPGF